MTSPVDLMTGAQTALIKLLRDQLPADKRQMVRHSLDEDCQPPFHLVGDIDTQNAGSKHAQAEEIEVDLHTIYRGNDRSELLRLMHQVRVAADDVSIEIGGAAFRVEWLGAIASTAAADGVTYAGVSTLRLFAEPA